jgi:hypothetical protein
MYHGVQACIRALQIWPRSSFSTRDKPMYFQICTRRAALTLRLPGVWRQPLRARGHWQDGVRQGTGPGLRSTGEAPQLPLLRNLVRVRCRLLRACEDFRCFLFVADNDKLQQLVAVAWSWWMQRQSPESRSCLAQLGDAIATVRGVGTGAGVQLRRGHRLPEHGPHLHRSHKGDSANLNDRVVRAAIDANVTRSCHDCRPYRRALGVV